MVPPPPLPELGPIAFRLAGADPEKFVAVPDALKTSIVELLSLVLKVSVPALYVSAEPPPCIPTS